MSETPMNIFFALCGHELLKTRQVTVITCSYLICLACLCHNYIEHTAYMCKLSPQYLSWVLFCLLAKTRTENHLALLIILHVSWECYKFTCEMKFTVPKTHEFNAIKTDNFFVAFLFLSSSPHRKQLLDTASNSVSINIRYLLKLLPTSHSSEHCFPFCVWLRNYRSIMITFSCHCYVHETIFVFIDYCDILCER